MKKKVTIVWPPKQYGWKTFDEYKELLRILRQKIGYSYKPERSDYVMKWLKYYSEIRIDYKGGMTIAEVRDKFTAQKRAKRLFRARCMTCGVPCECRHHVIQIQNGGRNEKKNLVPLCDGCHGQIHPWLDVGNKRRR